jgi:hypothetical protein
MTVTNVLLGQPASSTSQCHERPTFKQLGNKNSDMYPTMYGSKELLVDGKSNCLAACQEDEKCVAVSYFVSPFLSMDGNNCITLPNTILGDGTVWVNAPVLDTENFDKAELLHFSKHVPYQRFEEFSNHIHDGAMLKQACVPDLAECKARCTADLHCTGFTFYGDEDDESSASVCAMTGDQDGKDSSSVFADGPFAQMPDEGVSANLGRPPRLGESSAYSTTENYGIALGLDKVTDGFYQPLAAEGTGLYSRQGFLHTCGETDADQVVVRTTELSRVYAVRVWRRCDSFTHRSIGLKIMQQVKADDGSFEWLACGGVTTEEDATCSMFGPEQQFFERTCNHAFATNAIKVVRAASPGGIDAVAGDPDYRALDIPEIEAFGATFFAPADVPADDEYDELEPEDIMELHYALTSQSIPDGDDGCDTTRGESAAGQQQEPPSAVVHTEPLMVCTVSTTTVAPSIPTEEGDNGDDVDPGEELDEEETSTDTTKKGMSGGAIAAVVIVLLLLLLAAGAAYKYREPLQEKFNQHFRQSSDDVPSLPATKDAHVNPAYTEESNSENDLAESYLNVLGSNDDEGDENVEYNTVAGVGSEGPGGSAPLQPYETTDDSGANAPEPLREDGDHQVLVLDNSNEDASTFSRERAGSVYDGFA